MRFGGLCARMRRRRRLCLVDVVSRASLIWSDDAGVMHVVSGSLAMLYRGWQVGMFFGRYQVNVCGVESAISLAEVGGCGFSRGLVQD